MPASGKTPSEVSGAASNAWQLPGKVLLVDDEEIVLKVGEEMLKELGFEVSTAMDGAEAVEVFKNIPDLELVLLDLTMPRLDGEQCYHLLRQLKPEVKVIFTSGYSERSVTDRLKADKGCGFIQKPYTLDLLRDAIEKALAGYP